MDTQCAVSFVCHGILWIVAVIANAHSLRRVVPPLVLKFRALVLVHVTIYIASTSTKAVGSDDEVVGFFAILSAAFLWPEVMYFLQNFVGVMVNLEKGPQMDQQVFSRLMSCWGLARVVLLVSMAVLAVVFAAVPLNSVILVRYALSAVFITFVVLPIALVTIRSARAMRRHRFTILSDNQADGGTSTGASAVAKTLKTTEMQLYLFSVVAAVIFVYSTYSSIRTTIDLSRNPGARWESGECSGAGVLISDGPILIAVLLTRCPKAPPRSKAAISRTRGASSTGTSSPSGSPASRPKISAATVTDRVSSPTGMEDIELDKKGRDIAHAGCIFDWYEQPERVSRESSEDRCSDSDRSRELSHGHGRHRT